MFFNKLYGKIVDVKFSKEEQKALDRVIKEQCAEYLTKTQREVDAMVLYTLMCNNNFGEKRLWQYYKSFGQLYRELMQRYEMSTDDMAFVYTQKLKDRGIDLEAWESLVDTLKEDIHNED